jgi:hypothetical protein
MRLNLGQVEPAGPPALPPSRLPSEPGFPESKVAGPIRAAGEPDQGDIVLPAAEARFMESPLS